MSKRFLALVGALALLAPLAAAQAKSPDAAAGPATSARRPASPEEAAALKTLAAAYNDPTTSANNLDTAITSFRTQFPASAYTEPVLVLGLRYARAHSDYLHLLEYGIQVLQLDPHNLYTLSSLGAAIPDNVKQSDLDMEQRLTQAAGFDQEVITVASGLMVSGTGLVFQGIQYTAAQANTLKDNLEGPAYLSLGRIASLRQQYPAAIEAFRKALPFEATPARQAPVYFDIGQAQASADQIPEAEASFTKALALDPNSPLLDNMVKAERDKLQATTVH